MSLFFGQCTKILVRSVFAVFFSIATPWVDNTFSIFAYEMMFYNFGFSVLAHFRSRGLSCNFRSRFDFNLGRCFSGGSRRSFLNNQITSTKIKQTEFTHLRGQKLNVFRIRLLEIGALSLYFGLRAKFFVRIIFAVFFSIATPCLGNTLPIFAYEMM